MTLRSSAVVATLVALVAPAAAEPRPLTLRAAVDLAIARNPTLASSRIGVIDAEAHQLAALGPYDPTLEITAVGQDGRHDPRVLPWLQELHRDQVVGKVLVTKRFEDGGRVQVGVEGAAEKVASRVPTGEASVDITLVTLTPTLEARIDEPLLGGRRAGAAEAAKLDELHAAAQLDELGAAEQVVRDVEQAYWQLYLAQQEVEIRAHAVQLAEGQLRVVESEISRGSRPTLAANEVEEELARRREDELVARGAVAERAIGLAQLLGLGADTELSAADAPSAATATPSKAIVQAALAHSPLRQAAIARANAAGFDLTRTEDGARWRVDTYLRGTLSAPSDGVRDALANTAGYGGWTVEAGLSVRVPLGDAAPRGATDSARAQLVHARIEIADIEGQVAAAATRAENRLDVAIQRRAALARSVELAQLNLDAEQRRWERGDGTSFELLRRQAALADTQLRAARARIDELAASADVETLTGELLANRHVSVDGAAVARSERHE